MSKYLLVLIGATALMGSVALRTYAGPAEAAREQVSGSTNAALRYWQAISMLDTQLGNQTECDLSALYEPQDIYAGTIEGLSTFVTANQSIVKLFITASRVSGCDFVDNSLETDGVDALLPHLSPMRRGVRLLIADGLMKFKDGNSLQGAESLAAAFRMARHMQNDGVTISSLVSMSMFQQAAHATELLLDQGLVNESERVILAASLSGFAHDDPFAIRRSITRERDVYLGWIRREFSPDGEPPRETMEALRSMLQTELGVEVQTLLGAIKRGDSLEPYLKLAEHYYNLCVAAWDAPDAYEQLQELGKQLKEGKFGPLNCLIGSWDRPYKSHTRAKAVFHSLQDRLRP